MECALEGEGGGGVGGLRKAWSEKNTKEKKRQKKKHRRNKRWRDIGGDREGDGPWTSYCSCPRKRSYVS